MFRRPIHATSEVFGVSKDLPLNYITRNTADTVFVDSLTRNKHLIIHGSSKQGKTSLRKHNLQSDDYIVVTCSNNWDIADLHAAILKVAGYTTTQSSEKTISGKNKATATLKAGFKIPLASSMEGGINGESEKTETLKLTAKKFDLDLDDVNDIIHALKEINFKQYIVLEDFHYLRTETQRDFAIALKAFHEGSKLLFIIIGVWLEEGRLTVYNGDLAGRLISINADKWELAELQAVIHSGEKLLNVKFDETFKNTLIAKCFDSVHIVQEACYQTCVLEGIDRTSDQLKTIGAMANVDDLIAGVVNQHNARYNSFITQISFGFQSTELEMYKWILYVVLKTDSATLEKGLRLKNIRREMEARHPSGENLNAGNVTQALQSISNLQTKKSIQPIILDYDQNDLNLRVVDKSFLIWLENQPIAELITEKLGIPYQEH